MNGQIPGAVRNTMSKYPSSGGTPTYGIGSANGSPGGLASIPGQRQNPADVLGALGRAMPSAPVAHQVGEPGYNQFDPNDNPDAGNMAQRLPDGQPYPGPSYGDGEPMDPMQGMGLSHDQRQQRKIDARQNPKSPMGAPGNLKPNKPGGPGGGAMPVGAIPAGGQPWNNQATPY